MLLSLGGDQKANIVINDWQPNDRDMTLTLHGLDVDNGKVRADVFAVKFRALLSSLRAADKFANRKKSHEYVIETAQGGSIYTAVRERISVKKRIPAPSIPVMRDALMAVYNGEQTVERFPKGIIDNIRLIAKDAGKKFSHGEVGTKDNLVRIDDYLVKQVSKAEERILGTGLIKPRRHFEGISFGTFDGIVKEMDARGQLVRGKLILTAGEKEIDCIFRRDDLPTLKLSFDLRARVEGMAHYDGESLLPVRLDVRRIAVTEEAADLLRWRKALAHKRGRRKDPF
ncbi:MAG: hypothetical protein Q7S58_03220 [Candidatus Binatus sp.]|uniref:hypothetical protein n=1 Tax=Candidatus Binatus sp. TaxID=2811406 RepID=UPI00272255DA|nr:hypothetical protein [Candidatus Binatus sp.]MDO8431400.1 hypothetical protein [Candidatus Binatus sp.]